MRIGQSDLQENKVTSMAKGQGKTEDLESASTSAKDKESHINDLIYCRKRKCTGACQLSNFI